MTGLGVRGFPGEWPQGQWMPPDVGPSGFICLNPWSASALSEWEKAEHQAREIGQLENDWDGYGGAGISSMVLSNTIHALEMLASCGVPIPTPDLSPTSAGTILLSWEHNGAEGCLEIGNTRYTGYLKIDALPPALFEGNADRIDTRVFWSIAWAILSPKLAPTVISEFGIRSKPADARLAA
ncbi:MAG: hypothetical protein AB1714_29460 [Acidobacteriota bacterium]